ncbi:MAG: GNAT family N-acetyltransferase [Butyrivibrio sp.]|nr:GNAT family N-acetyltransferase [Butyrivibrio sp.]
MSRKNTGTLPTEPLLTGTKVTLRPITEADTPLIVRWRANPRVRHNFIFREEITPEIHGQWLAERVATGGVIQFIICVNRMGGRPVGSVYLRDVDRVAQTAEYGVFIGEDDAVGQGYGTETARLVVQWALEVAGLRSLILRVFVENTPARRSYEAAGFRVIQDLPQVRCSDGEIRDMVLMQADNGKDST